MSPRLPGSCLSLRALLGLVAFAATPALAAETKIEKVQFQKSAEAAEFTVRLSAPLAHAPSVRTVGGYVAFALPGVVAQAPREELEAADPQFEKAVLLGRADALLVAVRTKDAALVSRARIEGDGKVLRLRLFRTAEGAKQSDAARDLERSLDGAEGTAVADKAGAPAKAGAKTATTAEAVKGAVKESGKKTALAASPDGPATEPGAAAATAGARPGDAQSPAEPARIGIKSASPVLGAQSQSGLSTSTRAVAAVGFLAIAALVAMWLAKRSKHKGRGRSPISILAAQPAPGGKRHILLVEVHGERLLLGSAEGGITLLARVDTPEHEGLDLALDEDAQPRFTAVREAGNDAGSGGLLGKLRSAFGGKPAPAPARRAEDAPAKTRNTAVSREVASSLSPRERVEVAGDEPVASRAATQSPAWTVALSDAMSARGAQSASSDAAASSTADLIRRKLAELNRA